MLLCHNNTQQYVPSLWHNKILQNIIQHNIKAYFVDCPDLYYAEFCSAECHYPECRGAEKSMVSKWLWRMGFGTNIFCHDAESQGLDDKDNV